MLASEVWVANTVIYLRSGNCNYAFYYMRNGMVLRTSRVAQMCVLQGYADFRACCSKGFSCLLAGMSVTCGMCVCVKLYPFLASPLCGGSVKVNVSRDRPRWPKGFRLG